MCDHEVTVILMSLSLWSGQIASWLQCVSFIWHFLLSTSPLNLFHHLSPAPLPLSISYSSILPFLLSSSLPVLYHFLFPLFHWSFLLVSSPISPYLLSSSRHLLCFSPPSLSSFPFALLCSHPLSTSSPLPISLR